MSDTPYGKIITSLANLAKLPCDDDEHIRRSPVMDEVVRVRENADLLERENAALRAKLEEARKDAERWNFVMRHWPYADALWRVVPNEITLTERHLNNAIDAAIAAGNGEK